MNGIVTSTGMPDFQAQQHKFCAWLRDPSQAMPADVAPARMQVYRELLYHNVCNFIDMVYPVAQVLVGQAQWQHWQQQFFTHYRCSSPFYLDISLHFRDYLQADAASALQLAQYPWLHELLQYEWLELYLDTMLDHQPNQPSDDQPNHPPDYQCSHPQHHQPDSQDDICAWQLTRAVWVLVYQYPVYQWHQGTSANDISNLGAAPSAIVVWRAADHRVQMRPISPLYAIALSELQKQFEDASANLNHQQLLALCQSQCADVPNSLIQQSLTELKQQLQHWHLLPNSRIDLEVVGCP